MPGNTNDTGGAARFNRPRGIAVDQAGNIYVTESGNRGIRKITPGGMVTSPAITSISGGLYFPESTDISANTSVAYGAIAVDPVGNLFVSRFQFADHYTHAPKTEDNYIYYVGFITKITPDGTTSDLWETYVQGFVDGRVAGRFVAGIAFDQTGQLITSDHGLAFDRTGNQYLADADNNILRKVSPAGVETTLAGLSVPSARGTVDGPGTTARFTHPQGAALDPAGNLFVTDSATHCIRKTTPAGVVTTFAGSPENSGSTDGIGSAARFNQPTGITVDRTGNLYVADTGNHTIRKISPAGESTTLAGTAGVAGSEDGQGPAASFWYPRGVAVDTTGNVYVAGTTNDVIRKITPAGIVTTLAAALAAPYGIAIDASGNLFVTESVNNNSRIRKITPAGEITTIAGDVVGSTDGTGTAALFLHQLNGIAVDAAGNLYIADTNNQTVRKIAPDKTVTTLAGLVGSPGSIDGAGSAARFYYPQGIAVDASGILYLTSGTTVRKGQLATSPMITDQPRSQTAATGANISFTVTASGIPAPTYQWYVNGNAINGATDTTLSLANVRSTDAGDYTVVVTNPLGTVTSSKTTLTVSAASAPAPTPSPTPAPSGNSGGGSIGAWFGLALLTLFSARRWMAAHCGT